jgi:arylsulfatase A-like enzyme
VPTLAELMAQAGYVTAAFNVQYVLSNRYGLNRGFHYYRNHPNDTPANALNDELLPFLAEHAEDNLFTWVHYFDPHGPYRPPLRFRDFFAGDPLWAADTRKLERGEQAEGQPLIPKYVFDGGKFERRHYVGAYDADLAWTDSELGRLVDWLKATSANDTLIVVTADHGESMTDHDRYFCHGSLYEHDIHVPMVVWGPGVVAGPRDVRTAHVDILPTLLDYAGVGALPGFAGSSLRPLLAGGAWTPPPFTLSVVGRAENLRYAVVGDSGQKAIVDRGGGVLSAYDLLVDPQETASARGAAKKGVVAMARDFRKWLKGVTVKESKAQSADTEDQERLRALGYIE